MTTTDTAPITADLLTAVRRATAWLNDANGCDHLELLLRINKITEEMGEVSAALIGWTGQNPRKGVTHSQDDVHRELVDVALAALTALASMPGVDLEQVVADAVAGLNTRFDQMGVPR